VEWQLDKLPGCPGYPRGWRLTAPGQWGAGNTVHVHELAGGLIECDCEHWPQGRTCEHVKLLVADGLLEEPVSPDQLYQGGLLFPDSELIDIDLDMSEVCEHDWHERGMIGGATIYDCPKCGQALTVPPAAEADAP
jgi:hypothetical protein